MRFYTHIGYEIKNPFRPNSDTENTWQQKIFICLLVDKGDVFGGRMEREADSIQAIKASMQR